MKVVHWAALGAWIPVLLLVAVADAGSPGGLSHIALPLAGVAGLALAVAARPREDRHAIRRALLALFPLLALLATYAINPTHRVDLGGAPVPVPHWRAAPGTVFRPGTLAAGGQIVAALSVFALSAIIGSRASRVAWILIAAIGGGLGFVAIQQRILSRPFPVFDFTGSFVSPNHFAAFANLAIPVALGAGLRARYRAIRAGAPANPSPLFYLAALLMAAAIALSRSRAGTALLLFSLACWSVILWRLDRKYGYWRPLRQMRLVSGLPLLLALLATALAAGRFRGIPAPKEWAFRGQVVRDTLAIWRDRPVWGVGPGAFAVAFPFYQTENERRLRLLHAHCEPAQFLAEFGTLGAIIAVASFGVCASRLSRSVHADRGEMPRFAEIERPASAIAVATLTLHALVDFPLRAPAIALLAAFCAGQCCRRSSRRPGTTRQAAGAGI